MRPSYFGDLEGIADFEYIEPKTVKEACSLLSQYKEKAKVIAGGTQLLASMRRKEIAPHYLINLKSIPNLETITHDDDEGTKIGALTTFFEMSRSPLVNDKAKIFLEAIQQRETGLNQTRWAYYMATLGGYLSHAVTSADILPPLIVLGAKAVIEGPKGWKTLALEDLFDDTGKTAFQNDEVLIEVRIPGQPAETGLIYLRNPGTGGTPTLRAAVLLKMDAKHVNTEAFKIVVAGITPRPLKAREAEGILKGKAIDNDLIEEAAQVAARETSDGSDTETMERVKELIEEGIRQAVDLAIGDFALGY
jgi:carbon-monoxide dehydrogenase medium subunit